MRAHFRNVTSQRSLCHCNVIDVRAPPSIHRFQTLELERRSVLLGDELECYGLPVYLGCNPPRCSLESLRDVSDRDDEGPGLADQAVIKTWVARHGKADGVRLAWDGVKGLRAKRGFLDQANLTLQVWTAHWYGTVLPLPVEEIQNDLAPDKADYQCHWQASEY